MQIRGEGSEIGPWLCGPQRGSHPGNCSVHTKHCGGLHYSSPGERERRTEAGRGKKDGVKVEWGWRDKMWRHTGQCGKKNNLDLHMCVCVCVVFWGLFLFFFLFVKHIEKLLFVLPAHLPTYSRVKSFLSVNSQPFQLLITCRLTKI